MSEIDDVQARLSDALGRIETALTGHRPPQDNSSMLDALKEQLEEERVLTAQLQERIRALHEKENTLVESHSAEISAMQDALAEARQAAETAEALRDEVDAILADLKPQLEGRAHA